MVAFASFGLGRTSVSNVSVAEIRIEAVVDDIDESVVASRSGSKYHYPWCSGAARIKESNKISFESPEAARKAGYEPAKNCKGLK